MTQLYLIGWSDEVLEFLLARDDDDSLGLIPTPLGSFVVFSPLVACELPKSKADPGILGVFAEEPKDAKTPDPSPKAELAPLVGEVTLLVERGAIPLRGFVLLLKESKRLAG